MSGLIYVWQWIITALSSAVRQTGPAEPYNGLQAACLGP